MTTFRCSRNWLINSLQRALYYLLTLLNVEFTRFIVHICYLCYIQVWRLLRAIYRPHNYYCIHMDKKSPQLYKKWLNRKISGCIPSEVAGNIIFIDPIPVHHSYMSVLDADLACMRALWQLPSKDPASKTPPWKYLINLTGQEFPLKNNLELTRILRVLNNANLIQQEK